jgi:hypothetical protein
MFSSPEGWDMHLLWGKASMMITINSLRIEVKYIRILYWIMDRTGTKIAIVGI